jgi:hypothetical protein
MRRPAITAADGTHPQWRLDLPSRRPYLRIVRRSKSVPQCPQSADPAQGASMSSDQPYRPGALAHLSILVADALAPARRRTAAVVRLHPLDRLDRWFWRQRQKDRDAYLAGSTDIADVERRLRDLERRPYY